MAKKTIEICKAFGNDIEEATKKLQSKFKGFVIIHPEFINADLDYDAGEFEREGVMKAWAKFTQVIEVDEKPLVNHPVVTKKTRVKVA